MQFMLDQLTPEQMRQQVSAPHQCPSQRLPAFWLRGRLYTQAEMLENMDPSALSSMAPQLGNVSAEQLKMISGSAWFVLLAFSRRGFEHERPLASQ